MLHSKIALVYASVQYDCNTYGEQVDNAMDTVKLHTLTMALGMTACYTVEQNTLMGKDVCFNKITTMNKGRTEFHGPRRVNCNNIQ